MPNSVKPWWHDEVMEKDVPVTKELADAWNAVLGESPTKVDAALLLSTFLYRIAQDFGLSGFGNSDALDDSMAENPVKAILQKLLPETEGPADPETVMADLIYSALSEIALNVDQRALIDKVYRLEKITVLTVGQIYWNLPHTSSRPDLPLREQGKILIPVPRSTEDFAEARWSKRMTVGANSATAKGLKGLSLRAKGARLALLIAQYLLKNHPELGATPIKGIFERRDDGSIKSIRWQENHQITPVQGLGLQDLEAAMREQAHKDLQLGEFATAAAMLSAVAQRLRSRTRQQSETDELVIGLISMETGAALLQAGQHDEAMEHFKSTAQSSTPQAESAPELVETKILSTVSFVGQGVVHLANSDNQNAEIALLKAAAFARELHDEIDEVEILIPTVLSLLGTNQIGSGELGAAEKNFQRAEKVAKKLVRRTPVVPQASVALIVALLSYVRLLVCTDRFHQVAPKATEALAIIDACSLDQLLHFPHRLFRAELHLLMAISFASLDQEEEASNSLRSARAALEAPTESNATGKLLALVDMIEAELEDD